MNVDGGNRHVGKGALAGAIGGVLGALAMSSFAGLRRRLTHRHSRSELTHLEASRYVKGSNLELDSIAFAADRLDRLAGRRMSRQQKSVVAAGMHFAFGALLGSAYGAAAEKSKLVTRGFGVPFAVVEAGGGNVAWTTATRSLTHYSIADQAASIIDHAVYGAVLEGTRRALRKAA